MEKASMHEGEERAEYSHKTMSDLTDDLLICVISCLTIKEAARTSVLGRRWRYLWTYRRDLDFNGWKIMISYCGGSSWKEELEFRSERFVKLVNQVVNWHEGRTIDQFRIRFTVASCFTHDVDTWIKFAFAKGVKTLHLDLAFDIRGISCGGYKYYSFPNICHPIENLHLLPLGFPSSNRLETLVLNELNVSGEVLEYFIANCPRLEVLHVKGSRCLSSLRIGGSSLCLKSLEIRRCKEITHLEISAPNLVSFVYGGPKVSVDLKNIPLLVNLSLEASHESVLISNFLSFSCCFPQLETLTLDCHILEGWMKLNSFPDLPSLKKLVVRVSVHDVADLLYLASLIYVAPSLHEFTLMLISVQKETQPVATRAARNPHQCLKLAEIVGFVGCPVDLEFALYLLENAVSLEKLIIYPHPAVPKYWPGALDETSETSIARNRAELLKDKLPAGVDLVIR